MNGKKQRKLAEVRKNSHELFMEAKRRFQYRPEGKKFETKGSEPMNSPECSSVTDVCRQEHSNDFSWLDKMVNGFEWYHSKEERRRSHVGTTSGQENQTVIGTSNVSCSTASKPNYFNKKPAVLGQRSLNRPSTANQSYNGSNSNNNGKPIIKRSLQRIGSNVTNRSNNQGKQKKQLHEAVVNRIKEVQIHEFDPKTNMDEGFVEQQECPQLFPEIDTKKDDLAQLMKNLATEPAEMDVTILKLEEAKPKQCPKAMFPTPEKSPEKAKNKPMGKIKKNVKKEKMIVTEKAPVEKKPAEQKPAIEVELLKPKPIYVPEPSRLSARRQTVPSTINSIKKISTAPLTNGITPPEPLKTSIVARLISPTAHFDGRRSSSFNKAPIQYCPQTIQEEEEERSCQTSGRLEQKFCQIFHELDEQRHGYIDKKNCYSESLNDQIRYLIGPILTKIKYQEKRYNLQTFVEEGKKIISALETHEISKLMKCSVLNRFFYLDTKRSDNQRMTTRVFGMSAEKVQRKSCSTIVRNGKFQLLDVESVTLPKKEDSIKGIHERSTADERNKATIQKNVFVQDRNISFGDRTNCLLDKNIGISLGNLSIIKTIETSRANEAERKALSPNQSESYQIFRNRSHSRSHSKDMNSGKEQAPAQNIQPLGHLKKNSVTASEDKLICRGGISREPYLRLSTGKSLDKLREEHIEQIRRTMTPDTKDQKPRLEDLSRQAYLVRQSRLSPRLETSQLDRSLQQNQDEQKYTEKDEYNRIDLLNERLNKYIRENHLKETIRQDKYETLSLEFAQLKKHLGK